MRVVGTLSRMNDERKGGLALIIAAIAGLTTMALHPTGHDLLAPGRFAALAMLGAAVHALAIASMPLSFLGALVLTRRLDAPDRLAVVALVVYGFAMVAGMAAAAVSGFVAPGVMRHMIDAPTSTDAWATLAHFGALLNQAFARILAIASATSIVLWSAAIAKQRTFPRSLAIYGLVIGVAIVLAVGSGHLRLDVHGFGAVTLLEAVWLVGAGVVLWRMES